MDFEETFRALTGNAPFPWQVSLYERFVGNGPGGIPASCHLPTGLGKTSVVAIWLLALAHKPECIPRRLVYVVNRRTVVDQTTNEVEKYRTALQTETLRAVRGRLTELCALSLQAKVGQPASPLALSTLRGQFADNREWSADPTRPAVIVGTVDMIGSRLLFSGYGVGFKGKPLHAGFLGQDVLLVHDEAHLEPAFQKLLNGIEIEQNRCGEFQKFRVMELSATSRGGGDVFKLSADDEQNATVKKRIGAPKALHLHEAKDDKKLADDIAELSLTFKDSGRAIVVFVRTVEDVMKVHDKLAKENLAVETLTGTRRGKERDELVDKPTFRRFLPKALSGSETVYLVCTSAGEVGVNISADHLVCDLSTFESMAQRFGRVNRFGEHNDTEIHVVLPIKFDLEDDYDSRRKLTFDLLKGLKGDGSPQALGNLDPKKRLAAFAPTPTILPVTDILFDAWALTTIKGKLPGRPPVEPYLHGLPTSWQPPETRVAWRKEVWELRLQFKNESERAQRESLERKRLAKLAEGLLEDYPLKPHELLRDNSARVFDRLKKLKAPADTPVWIQSEDESILVTTLGTIVQRNKDELNYTTLILPEQAGGLNQQGMLDGGSETAEDVADEWFLGEEKIRQRIRFMADNIDEEVTKNMRLIRRIEIDSFDGDDAESRFWHWFEIASEGGKSSKKPVLWDVHVSDVVENTKRFISRLSLSPEIKTALAIAAQFHDHGKQRKQFQTVLGNMAYPKTPPLAKSGKQGGRIAETYRHEFGSLLDIQGEQEFTRLSDDMKDLVLHLIAVHHGRARPHFPSDEVFDPERPQQLADDMAMSVPRRFARLQRKYGRWGLAYLESLLRAADWAASAYPSRFVEDST
jgi:CRISPR-associated endonuclease/helicase Cas3